MRKNRSAHIWGSLAGHGLFQHAKTPAPGSAVAGQEDFRNLEALPGKGFTVYRDRRAGFSWLFDGKTFWTYDDPPVMTAKMNYLKSKGLAGVMFWELSGDTSTGELITTLYNNR